MIDRGQIEKISENWNIGILDDGTMKQGSRYIIPRFHYSMIPVFALAVTCFHPWNL